MIVIVQFLKTHASFSKNFGYLINNDTGLVIQILNQLKLYLQKHFQPHITHLHTLLATILCKGNTLLIILHFFSCFRFALAKWLSSVEQQQLQSEVKTKATQHHDQARVCLKSQVFIQRTECYVINSSINLNKVQITT